MADEELRRHFAKMLNYYLVASEHNQADLARYMKVSTATTAKWCTGQTIPRIDKIQSICNWLGIEKSDLLDDHPVKVRSLDLTGKERELVLSFRKASPELQDAALRMFGIEPEKKEGSNIA